MLCWCQNRKRLSRGITGRESRQFLLYLLDINGFLESNTMLTKTEIKEVLQLCLEFLCNTLIYERFFLYI